MEDSRKVGQVENEEKAVTFACAVVLLGATLILGRAGFKKLTEMKYEGRGM